MNHPAELAMLSFLQKAMAGESTMTEEVADKVASDVKNALFKQFDSGPRDDFRLRMSNIGKPRCQLWFEKNDPEDKTPFPPNFLMNMILGDIVEAVFKGIMRAANIDFKDNDYVTLKLPNGVEIKGEYDMELEGKIDDVKSASPWSYQNKFASFDALATGDSFGYIPQLVGYAEGAGKEVGGWWVVNKANGEFKYVSADGVDKQAVLDDIEDLTDYINNDEPFEREFEPIEETFYRKKTGNTKLGVTCGFCAFKHKCWPMVQTIPSVVSKAQNPPIIDYIHIEEKEYNDA